MHLRLLSPSIFLCGLVAAVVFICAPAASAQGGCPIETLPQKPDGTGHFHDAMGGATSFTPQGGGDPAGFQSHYKHEEMTNSHFSQLKGIVNHLDPDMAAEMQAAKDSGAIKFINVTDPKTPNKGLSDKATSTVAGCEQWSRDG